MVSLGATDDVMKKLGTLYWYTIEFGAIKEKNTIKAYGSGILSSFGECENFKKLNKKHFHKFDIQRIINTPVLI